MLKVLAAFAALSLAACGDGLIRVADGGLANIECKDGTYARFCTLAESPSLTGIPLCSSGIREGARPNGLGVTPADMVQRCHGNNSNFCCLPDGGPY